MTVSQHFFAARINTSNSQWLFWSFLYPQHNGTSHTKAGQGNEHL